MSTDLAITGIQANRAPHKRGAGYRVKSETSYVDETLFGTSCRAQTRVVNFNPPWVSSSNAPTPRPLLWSPQSKGPGELKSTAKAVPLQMPTKSSTPLSTPRKTNKYRLKSHSPSYCDESLFGPKPEDPGWEPPWVRKEDTISIRPLLWSPPASNKISSRPSSTRDRGVPMKAFHPDTLDPRLTDLSEEYKGKTNFWKRPESDSGSNCTITDQDKAQFVNRIQSSYKGTEKLDTTRSKIEQCKTLYSANGNVTGHWNHYRPRSASASDSQSLGRSKIAVSLQTKRPWKY
ncbi:RBPJ-interacting and tubulin-associated protein 1 [Protopterus annectens]|uniref:RBPJ-interacting and tubulin-associated protein 1 n=1 Tax=Protopterus annectens TaxID=7888 RepID=UPI001CFB1855|nr:RBPJ-interacting and tubulin-associated protein 1 [Protopterus annectens]XP_043924374.1 RBPJ-interacting and tubulin-associated protein 1 [Protopterus annectens]